MWHSAPEAEKFQFFLASAQLQEKYGKHKATPTSRARKRSSAGVIPTPVPIPGDPRPGTADPPILGPPTEIPWVRQDSESDGDGCYD
jgi:hypothetical protein